MIAMANPFAGYMTVREAMEALQARAASTVTRLVREENAPPAAGKPLVGVKVAGHGWFITRKSVAAYIEAHPPAAPKIGFPRGVSRKPAKAAKAGRGQPRKAKKS